MSNRLRFGEKIKSSTKMNTYSVKSLLQGFLKKKFNISEKKRHYTITSISIANYIVLLIFVFIVFLLLILSSADLTIIRGNELYSRSVQNHLRRITIYPNRGVIKTSDGMVVAKNKPSVKLFLDTDSLYIDNTFSNEKLEACADALEEVIGTNWKYYTVASRDITFDNISNYLNFLISSNPESNNILLFDDLSNATLIDIKTAHAKLSCVYPVEGSIRTYPESYYYSPILGYVGRVFAEDIENLDYVDVNDVIGKTGIEKEYDKYLIGKKGAAYVEVDALGNMVSESIWIVEEAEPGYSLELSINDKLQRYTHDTLIKAVRDFGATSGTVIIENINDGSIITMASYPSYDSNLFVKGLTQSDFEKILNTPGNPLVNKAISAQAPPGSTFKTLVALSALDAGVITPNTVYVSTSNYRFSNGARFQEYHNHAYGPLTVRDALMRSSNIFFCETIRNWDIEELDDYLTRFKVGEPTGVDIPGEMPGRLPSPENKIILANTTSPWLDPIWYPEGDSCNSVIGQGITLVTPIQLVNWASMIANNGTILTPHVVTKKISPNGEEEMLTFPSESVGDISASAFQVVREGMRMSVAGSYRIIVPLTDAKVQVAAKTGTAEFGMVDENGIYEHTHAWVMGFFPYEDPKYAFVVFLEDGGESNNASVVIRQVIDFMFDNKLIQ